MARPPGRARARHLKRLAAVAVALAALLAACVAGGPPAPTPPPGGVLVRIGEGVLASEVASTPEARRTGLMHRTELAPDAGMLFVFPSPTIGAFWMKNTLVPLSIAFIAAGGEGYEVLAVLEMEPCTTDPCPRYRPGVVYDLALEANRGWFRRHGVRQGSPVVVEGSLPGPS